MGSVLLSTPIIAPTNLDRHQILRNFCHESVRKGLIKDTILTEEQEPVSVKGFAHPVRVYRVVGIYDELEKDGRVIREERDGFRLLVDLTKGDQARAIAAVENVLARLKG